MSEVRLNDGLRSRLYALVTSTVKCPVEEARLNAAYAVAEPLVRAAVQTKYPPRDMRVCEKYEAASIDDCIKLQLSAGGVDTFNFAKGTGPLVVKKTHQGQIYLADEATTSAFHTWKTTRFAFDEAIKKKAGDYNTLVREARTLEEVTEIWPEADAVREYARSRALSVLSDEMVARIKADVEARKRDLS
jgi:hypothetical protein